MKTKKVKEIVVLQTPEHPSSFRCGFCPIVIYKHNEAGGRLRLLDGKPICAKCRVLNSSKFASQIKNDKDKYAEDVASKDAQVQAEFDIATKRVALESQIATKTEINRS